MSFREQTKKMRQDLQRRTQESIDRGEDLPEYGSIFIRDKLPDGVGFWKPDFGDHLIDVIPFIAGKNHPAKIPAGRLAYHCDLWVHQNIGPLYDQFVCQVRRFKGTDPMCEYMRGRRLPTDEWKAIAPKRRCAYLIWCHDTVEEEEKGIQVWEVAWWNFEKNVDEIAKNPKGGDPIPFSDYDRGKSIAFAIKKSGTFVDSSGKERDSVDYVGHRFVDRDEPIPDGILNLSFCLDDCIDIHPSYDKMLTAFPLESKEAKKVDRMRPQEPETPEAPSSDDEPPPPQEEMGEKPWSEPTETSYGFDCPGGGTPGLDIEKLPECAKCQSYEECSDLADTKATPPPPKEEEKKKPEARTRKRIVRRRR